MAKIHTLLSIGAASLLLVTVHAQAVSYTYDFSGNLSDQFTLVYSTPGHATSSQSGGQLTYNTIGAGDLFDDAVVYAHAFTPSFDQSWKAEVFASVPGSLDTGWTTGAATANNIYAEAALGVSFRAADGTSYSLANVLGLWDKPTDRHYSAQYSTTPVDGQWTWVRQPPLGLQRTTDATGLLGLSFDADSKVLRAYNAYGTLMSIAINSDADAQWGMKSGDHFQLALEFDSQGWVIPSNTPMTMDNFSAGTVTAPIPEPDSLALILGGLSTVGWILRRRQTVQ